MLRILKITNSLLCTFIFIFLVACGGGGGGGDPATTPPPPPPTGSNSFSVSLTEFELTRKSDDVSVAVNGLPLNGNITIIVED